MTRQPALYLSAVDERFDPALDVAVGPWCFVGREHLFPDWERQAWHDPLAEPAALKAADRQTLALSEDLCVEWGMRLDQRHGVSRGPEFWRMALILWMATAVQSTWYRWRILAELAAERGHQALDVAVVPDVPAARPASLMEFANWVIGDPAFDFAVSSRIIRRMRPAAWHLRDVPAVSPACETPAASPPPSAWRRWVDRLPVGSVGLGLARLPMALVLALSGTMAPGGRISRRPVAARGGFPGEYLAFLDEFLADMLPEAYLGQFAELDARAKEMARSAGRRLVANLVTVDDSARLALAHARMAGKRLFSIQHGGWYGTALTHPWAAVTDYAYDGCLTWGWTQHDDMPGRFIPLPSPELSRIAGRHRECRAELVFVGAYMFARPARLQTYPRISQYAEYRRGKLAFLEALPEPIRDATLYRGHPKSLPTFADFDYLAARHPRLAPAEGDLKTLMLGCRLMVIDHPGSSLHEAMAANVPVVAYWRPDHWPLSPGAEAEFDALRQAGVLFDDAVLAARHVAAVWDKADAWWNGVKVQQARAAWCRRHARTSRWWPLHWLQALFRL